MAKILVAEDNQNMLRIVSVWLRQNQHEVIEARDGEEAMNRLRAGGIDLLITDMKMPQMTGLEILQKAHSAGLLTCGAIMLTGCCDYRQIADRVVPYGCVVCPKPFSPSSLIRMIEKKLNLTSAQSVPGNGA